MNSDIKDMTQGVQRVIDHLSRERQKLLPNTGFWIPLNIKTTELSAAQSRLISLGEIDSSIPDLANRSQEIKELASRLELTQDVSEAIDVADQVVSHLDFVLAYVEPDEPWPR